MTQAGAQEEYVITGEMSAEETLVRMIVCESELYDALCSYVDRMSDVLEKGTMPDYLRKTLPETIEGMRVTAGMTYIAPLTLKMAFLKWEKDMKEKKDDDARGHHQEGDM